MRVAALILALFPIACGERSGHAPAEVPAVEVPGTQARFDLESEAAALGFFDLPYPSDLRLGERRPGNRAPGPDVRNFPNPKGNELVTTVLAVAGDRPGFPVTPVGYFRFSAALAPRDPAQVIPAARDGALLLVDLGEGAHRGELVPLVAGTPVTDDFVPANLLTVAPRPGVLLRPDRSYAFVVRRALGDAQGAPLGVPAALVALSRGERPAGARGAAAQALYATLWPVLDGLGVPRADVAAATVFTTGDVVREVSEISDALVTRHDAEIRDLRVDPDDGAAHERYCELVGTLRVPQFQQGSSPFDTAGLWSIAADGLPAMQRTEDVPFTISLPKTTMPAGGFPLALYVHGSSGKSSEVVDRGPILVAGGMPTKGEGHAHTLAPLGLALASSAMPVNVQRRPAEATGCVTINGYLNFCNLAAMRDVFRQGIVEQRLLLEALARLEIPADLVASCAGLAGGPFRFSERLVVTGNSMGGMYTNMVGATEPRVRAMLPAGAGGFWTYFILETNLVPGAARLLAVTLGAADTWSFMHPVLHLAETAWEPADPMVYMPRLARRPLPGHPVRHVFEPVGRGDSYFPTPVYDAMVLAYGHPQAGQSVWPSMQAALGLVGLEGLLPFPVVLDTRSEGGEAYTGAVVQYEGDGIDDPHCIVFQRGDLRQQMQCFFSTFLATGTPTIPGPGAACP